MPPSPEEQLISPSASDLEDTNNDLQPFFVLRKAPPQKSDRRSLGSPRAKRKIDLPLSSPKPAEKYDVVGLEDREDAVYEQLRFEAFNRTWAKIDATIKEVLRQINLSLFDELHQWVLESFLSIRSSRPSNLNEMHKPYPVVNDDISKQIPTAFLLTRNLEFVDDVLTYQELRDNLRSRACHVANLSTVEFSVKYGVGVCIRSLLRQLVKDAPDIADLSVLSSWYSESENFDRPLVVIIDDICSCSGSILGEFIKTLSEWVIKLPVIFVMGVTTTIEAPKKILPSDSLKHIYPCKFTIGTPYERMNALVEAVLVKPCSGFVVGHKVAIFLRNYFLKHDGTITSFVRALKLACVKHFSSEPLSFLGLGIHDEDYESLCHDRCETLNDFMLKYAVSLPSYKRTISGKETLESTADALVQGLSEVQRMLQAWSSVVLCLFEVGKKNKIQPLDIYCEAIDPSFCNLKASDLDILSFNDQKTVDERFRCLKEGFIAQAIQKVRELSLASLSELLNLWLTHTKEIKEIQEELKQLHLIIESADDEKNFKEQRSNRRKLAPSSAGRQQLSLNNKTAMLLDTMVRKYLLPIECITLHEIVCFKRVDILHEALIGDPRRTIQVDLLKPKTLRCSCCSCNENVLSSTMHDTSIMYNLAQEYGDLINLHEWYLSFKTIITTGSKSKQRLQHSPASKRKKVAETENKTLKKKKVTETENEVSIQARFCRAITELQITGLLRMPSKRRPDFVQRVAFGL